MLWQDDQVAVVDAAVARAREGSPTVLSVVGEPGTGKTSLLRELGRRASGFGLVHGEGEETAYREPYRLLRYLGIDDVVTAAGRSKDPLVAAQGLRDLVDGLSPSGPVALLVDDLQWVDDESIEALFWLISRAHGDRLLLAVGSRPELAASSDAWRRLIRRTSGGASLTLTGMDLGQATAMARDIDGSATEQVIQRLWEHTSGNPFYLGSLLRQYGSAELAAMRSLPAPVELAKRVELQLSRLTADAASLVQASAVLGYSWQQVPRLAAVGDVGDGAAARQELVDAGLIVVRGFEMTAAVRITHALARAAVYQSIPYPRRRLLHLRAAQESSTSMDALEHRVAATDHYDDELAEELQSAGSAAHAAGQFRRAAQLLRWSSDLTDDVRARNLRWLDGVVEMVLARDVAAVRLQLPAVQSAPDLPRRALVRGLMYGVEKRWLDALRAYTSVSADILATADSLTRYRLLVLRAWATVCAGRPLEPLAEVLARAEAEPVRDPALVGNEIFARGTLRYRLGDETSLLDAIRSVPAVSSEAPVPLTYALAWRGSSYAAWGHAALAEADLLEVTTRLRSGVADNGDGIYHGLLAYARWQRGSWSLAAADMRLALDFAVEQPHPMNRGIEPMLLAGRGDFVEADAKLRDAEDVLTVMPWGEAVHLFVISYVTRLHAGGDSAHMTSGLAHLRALFGDEVLDVRGLTGSVWIFHLALAAVWADDLVLAERLIADTEQQPNPPDWVAWVALWLRGLVADARGLTEAAGGFLEAAVTQFSDELPLYRAHSLSDHARISHARGDHAAAERAARSAESLYRELGAAPYLDRTVRDTPTHQRDPRHDVLAPLTDRERDVATLVVSGLSYAQVARELFVTRATVGFHLTRIYAKTNVVSRHELTALVRRGLST